MLEAMFLALRELRAARGRFALIGLVVALITLLLVMLSGLTEGLSKQNTSALEALGHEYEQASFSTQKPTFTESEIYEDDVVPGSAPLGTSQTKVEGFGGVAVLGLPAGEPIPGTKQQVPATGVVASQAITQGNSVVIGDETYAVRGTVPDLYYSHSPVLWVSTQTWAQLSHAPSDVVGTALLHANSIATGLPTSVSMREALSGLPSYNSERGSLLTMQGFLYAISALVMVAFLSIWTMQRTRDLSILRALGARTRYLLGDALAQSALILALGVGVGAAVGWGLGALAQSTVPFVLSARTIAAPAAGMWVLGMLGAVLATRRISKINPLDALGGQG